MLQITKSLLYVVLLKHQVLLACLLSLPPFFPSLHFIVYLLPISLNESEA